MMQNIAFTLRQYQRLDDRAKRAKLVVRHVIMPIEFWQHISTLLPPAMLHEAFGILASVYPWRGTIEDSKAGRPIQ